MRATLLNSLGKREFEVGKKINEIIVSLTQKNISAIKIDLEQKNVFPCMSCEGCLYITPGRCVQKDDTAEILSEIAKSGIIIAFTKITFGGYSADLKKIVDKFALLATPFYKVSNGSLLHPSRYGIQKHFIVVGVTDRELPASQKENFKLLVKRNSINLSIPSKKAIVVNTSKDTDLMKKQIMDYLGYGEIA